MVFMNKFSSKDILKNLSKANLVSISSLEMIVKNKNNQIKRSIAINEYLCLGKVGRQPHYLLNKVQNK